MNKTTETRLQDHVNILARQVKYGFDAVDGSDDSPVMDFLEGVLDFEWIIASDKETLLGARLLVAFGGPNIWIDTRKGLVEGYWWGSSAFASFDTDTDNARDLVDYLNMIWDC